MDWILNFRAGHFKWLFLKPNIFYLGLALFILGVVFQGCIHIMPEHELLDDVVFYLSPLVSILMLTVGALILEGSPYAHEDIRHDWFPALSDTPTDEHNLYVFCRADFDENVFLGTEEIDMDLDDIQSKIKQLDEKMTAVDG